MQLDFFITLNLMDKIILKTLNNNRFESVKLHAAIYGIYHIRSAMPYEAKITSDI